MTNFAISNNTLNNAGLILQDSSELQPLWVFTGKQIYHLIQIHFNLIINVHWYERRTPFLAHANLVVITCRPTKKFPGLAQLSPFRTSSSRHKGTTLDHDKESFLKWILRLLIIASVVHSQCSTELRKDSVAIIAL